MPQKIIRRGRYEACILMLEVSSWAGNPAQSFEAEVGAVHLMTDSDVQRILGWLDSALELFHKNKGHLTVREIRVLSMLAVAREELSDSAKQQSAPRPPKN